MNISKSKANSFYAKYIEFTFAVISSIVLIATLAAAITTAINRFGQLIKGTSVDFVLILLFGESKEIGVLNCVLGLIMMLIGLCGIITLTISLYKGIRSLDKNNYKTFNFKNIVVINFILTTIFTVLGLLVWLLIKVEEKQFVINTAVYIPWIFSLVSLLSVAVIKAIVVNWAEDVAVEEVTIVATNSRIDYIKKNLNEAKELFENGLINQVEYDALKLKIINEG